MYNYASITDDNIVVAIISTSEKQDNPKLIEIPTYDTSITTKIWNPVTKTFDVNPNAQPVVAPKEIPQYTPR